MGDDRDLPEKVRRIRPHANFFDWPVRETKELGVVKTLLESAHGDDLLASIREVRPGRPDPPDAIGARGAGGALVAIEVTELVDQDVTAHNVRVDRTMADKDWIERGQHRVMRVWDEAALVAAVDALLREKDGKTLHGGPFERYVVAVHTDEDMLDHHEADRWLQRHSFAGLAKITGAYLPFSYSPVIEGYPCIRLNVRQDHTA
jgi:hypothetical protein